MLDFLKVRNLAIVENAQVTFAPGLNIITGETGSGKSVLIGALSLVLGERADHGAVRSGARELAVEAAFSLADHAAVDAILDEAGLPPCEEGRLLVRRVVSAAGTGKCWVNDSPTTVATLRRVGERLIDMHGPYDHQSLLMPHFQLELLDAFGRTGRERDAYSRLFAAHADLVAEKEELLRDAGSAIDEEIDRLSFIVGEIDEANLTEDDGDSLVERHKEACGAQEILEVGGALVAGLTEGEDSAFDRLVAIQHQLGELARLLPEAAEWKGEAENAAIALQELSRTISDRLMRVDSDPETLAALEGRMELVQRLRRLRHCPPQLLDVLSALSLQDLHRLAHPGPVVLGIAVLETPAGAGAHVVVQAGPVLADVPGEFAVAVRQQQGRADGVDDLPGLAPAAEGAVVFGAVLGGPAGDAHHGVGLPLIHAHEGIALVVLQQDVVVGPVPLDEGVFQHQSLKLTPRHDHVEVRHLFHHGGHLGRMLPVKIAADPVFELFGLAHIDDLAPGVQHDIDPGQQGQMIGFFPQFFQHGASILRLNRLKKGCAECTPRFM